MLHPSLYYYIVTPKYNAKPKSFAETTVNATFPKVKQAIVINLVDGIKQIQYITLFGNINKSLLHDIQNNRFFMFLKHFNKHLTT